MPRPARIDTNVKLDCIDTIVKLRWERMPPIEDGRLTEAGRQPLHWRLRGRLSPSWRGRIRRVVDPALAPFGSVSSAATSRPEIAVTFDDGPDEQTTPGVLDALRGHGARATFFVLVGRAEAAPDLIGRMVREGHEIGLHGVDHHRLPQLASSEIAERLRAGRRRLEALTRQPVTLYRPPFGAQSLRSYLLARRAGLRVVVWSAHAEDWLQQAPAQLAERALARVRQGGVLLLHDAIEPDPASPAPPPPLDRGAAVELLLAGLARGGLRATTVSGLLAGGRTVRTAWFRP
jgi:peptidoglycan/xylan/chitin deacetylase (PgdA/CDA1 family)